MRCKPGDLARIIHDDINTNINKLVIIKGGGDPLPGEWRITPLSSISVSTRGCTSDVVITVHPGADCEVYQPDAWMEPVRGIGDDETDEMILLIGKPNEVTA